MPSWASETTSPDLIRGLTPRRPRLRSLREATRSRRACPREGGGLGLRRADIHAEHLAPPVRVDADSDDHRDRDDPMVAADFYIGRRPARHKASRLQGADRGRLSPARRSPRTGATPGSSRRPLRPSRVRDRRPSGSRRPEYRLPESPRSAPSRPSAAARESSESTTPSEASGCEAHRPGARLPVPVAIAVALGEPVGRAFAMGDAGSGAHFHLHRPLSGEGDHVAQNVRIGGLLHQPATPPAGTRPFVAAIGGSKRAGSPPRAVPRARAIHDLKRLSFVSSSNYS